MQQRQGLSVHGVMSMPPFEIFIGPAVLFAILYLFAWSQRDSTYGPTGPKHYAAFAAKGVGLLFLIGLLAHLTGCELGTLNRVDY